MEVSKIEELKKSQGGEIVSLPSFPDGTPLVVKLRRPSMLALAKSGRIPNALLTGASSLFEKGKKEKEDVVKNMAEMYDLCVAMAEECLVDPKYSALVQAGVQLTDAQLSAIVIYTQQGVTALDSFRAEQESGRVNDDGGGVQGEAE